MDFAEALPVLEEMTQIVERVKKNLYGPTSSTERARLVALYGEVHEVYKHAAGTHRVEVPESRGGRPNIFPNYFEAGWMSGRTLHTHEGYMELVKVVGFVRSRVRRPRAGIDERTAVIETLRRFRPCCQYLREAPADERAVQDIVWIMLRSRFDRFDREDVLPRFGVKTYRPDFGIPDLRLLIEAKYVSETTRLATIQEEILADLPAYLRDSGRFDSVLVFVYDAAHKLKDDRQFIHDLKTIDGVVEVIVVPGV